jgi:hypothetical protein
MDGLACAILLKEAGLVDRVAFAQPRDIERGSVTVTADDITAGLPYREGVFLAFDHYPGSAASQKRRDNLIVDDSQPSTARVICNHYGLDDHPGIPKELLQAVNKGFSEEISTDDILYPGGWVLLSYLIDQRTGLERYRPLKISTERLIERLIDYSRHMTIWEILDTPDVEERLELYFSCIEPCKAQLLRCSSVYYNLVVADLRREPLIYPGNRFLIYALFPECNVSMHLVDEPARNKSVCVVGKSILDRSFDADCGDILRQCGGSGHRNAGSCEVDRDKADALRDHLIERLRYSTLRNLVQGYFNFYTGSY